MNTQKIKSVIDCLAKRRPVFHSEADLQFEFAWEIAATTGLPIRLEVPTPGIGEIDLVIPQPATAIEFKYKTSQVQMIVGRETFHLSQHAAQPLGRYDVLKDLWRIEKAGLGGYVFFLTNDSSYWRPCKSGNGSAFSLEQGRQVHGRMSWINTTNKKSLGAGRMAPINISGHYRCDWNDYSFKGKFRYLLFSIA
jgi:hypothetical protein